MRTKLAMLGAELADQHAVSGKHPQRQLGPVVRQGIDRGQLGIGEGRGDHQHQQHAQQQAPGQQQQATGVTLRRSSLKSTAVGPLAGPDCWFGIQNSMEKRAFETTCRLAPATLQRPVA